MMKTRPGPIITQEELVFNIIVEYLKDNRTFRLEKIIPYIQSRATKASANLNIDGIKKNLNILLKKKSL